ncbi:MAG: hypothetical protein BAA00_01345 [Parageobacillus thermoglucosidasius]|uniref:DUF5808 domain-containing protein n=1 Tax=Parageobacillus thermoglucosidasius TaxID=1426 RepID=UPI00059DE15C|nr:DUF5808 domain-containing protein [Parageobacillus thermoglucosidasius]MBY6270017.1 hypothetical protein [Parageobacillus thermoglucosidasius]OUM84887.1 MAG: hypothetical protein BAA00_01345 [Parageobacillus thermoglucosidasius]
MWIGWKPKRNKRNIKLFDLGRPANDGSCNLPNKKSTPHILCHKHYYYFWERRRFLGEHWKGGIFYVSKEDPAIFVEQRSGNGFTINLGRPTGWFLLLLPFIFGFTLFLFARFV